MTSLRRLPTVSQELATELVLESSSSLSHDGASCSRIFAFNRGQRLKSEDSVSSCKISVTFEPSC